MTTPPLRGLVVCVNYDDLLAITLPRNIGFLSECMVVTSPSDTRTQELVRDRPVRVHVTDAFYRNGAKFNKAAAIEEALDVYGHEGWLLLWDADTVFPRRFMAPNLEPGFLYAPLRRVLEDVSEYSPALRWDHLKHGPDGRDFNGYFQLFHATDPVLAERPWFTQWPHAGGYDHLFQRRWAQHLKIRLPFEVLHLGPTELNWFGRISPRVEEGGMIAAYDPRRKAVKRLVAEYQRQRVASLGR